MKAPRINASGSDLALGLVVAVGLYLLYKGAKAAGEAVAAGAQAANQAAADVVGAIGSAVGLPTPEQTLNDPRQVRWIIDHVGDMTASQWSTAGAFYSALFSLNQGDGDATPPPDNVLVALGVKVGAAVPTTAGAVVDFTTGNGSLSDPSFADVANGRNDPFNPLRGLGG